MKEFEFRCVSDFRIKELTLNQSQAQNVISDALERSKFSFQLKFWKSGT